MRGPYSAQNISCKETVWSENSHAVLTEDPLTSSVGAQVGREVLDEVVPLEADVVAELLHDRGLAGLHTSVAALDAVAAEHDQVRPHVVSKTLTNVVETQPAHRHAERTLIPLAMKLA